MKVESVKISRVDSVFDVEINGHLLEGVKDYKITSSAEETTELVLKIDIPNAFTEFETSAIQRKRTS